MKIENIYLCNLNSYIMIGMKSFFVCICIHSNMKVPIMFQIVSLLNRNMSIFYLRNQVSITWGKIFFFFVKWLYVFALKHWNLPQVVRLSIWYWLLNFNEFEWQSSFGNAHVYFNSQVYEKDYNLFYIFIVFLVISICL